MSDPAKKVVGKALYLEFRYSDAYGVQLLFAPETSNPDGSVNPFTVYRRQVSQYRPRSQWRTTTAPLGTLDLSVALSGTEGFLLSLHRRGWRLYKRAIVVDVTAADAQDLRVGKLPYKVMGRVKRCRKALGFSEDLWGEDDLRETAVSA